MRDTVCSGMFHVKHLLLKVLENRELCPEHYLITLQTPRGFKEPQPGQFFHVVCDPDGEKTLINGKERGYALTLRRPFSVHRVHYAGFDRRLLAAPSIASMGEIPRTSGRYEIRDIVHGENPPYPWKERPVSKIDILYKVVGEGTRSLSQVRPGKLLDVIGPIGNGFHIEPGRAGVIVAGGMGVAPLVALAEKLRYLGTETHIYVGMVSHMHLQSLLKNSPLEGRDVDGTELCGLIIREFKGIGAETVTVCTDDGSAGEKGFVTDTLEADMQAGVILGSDITIYACGPSEMMRKVSDLAHKYEAPCQVLMEERMACGIGACFSCTCNVRDKDGNVEKKRVCVDGPVFEAKEIVW
jgi:dihydroorotate dehydrogenase electron transfer subunit